MIDTNNPASTRTCITHHYACDCREAMVSDLIDMVETLDTILRGAGPLYATGVVAGQVRALIARAKE
jgi:hypothetical protein